MGKYIMSLSYDNRESFQLPSILATHSSAPATDKDTKTLVIYASTPGRSHDCSYTHIKSASFESTTTPIGRKCNSDYESKQYFVANRSENAKGTNTFYILHCTYARHALLRYITSVMTHYALLQNALYENQKRRIGVEVFLETFGRYLDAKSERARQYAWPEKSKCYADRLYKRAAERELH